MKTVGSRAEVFHGTAKHTSGGLEKKDLLQNKHGRIVSRRKHTTAKKENRLKKHGYTAKKGTCEECETVVTITSCSDVTPNNEVVFKNAVAQQPVSVAIEADTKEFQLYTSGVITSDKCGTNLDHGVLTVGYGEENGVKYWLVKNSWSTSWGEDGYVKIGRSDSMNDPGICGIAMDPSFPVV